MLLPKVFMLAYQIIVIFIINIIIIIFIIIILITMFYVFTQCNTNRKMTYSNQKKI